MVPLFPPAAALRRPHWAGRHAYGLRVFPLSAAWTMDVAASLAAHAAPLEDTPEWCRFSLPPQLYSDPIELEGTRLAFESFFSGPNMFPSLRKDIDEDDPFLFTRARVNTIMTLAGGEHVKDPAGQAVPILFTFTPAGVLGAPPRPSSRAEAIKDASRRFSRANAVLFQQLQKFEARAAIVAACSTDLPGLSADMTSTSVPSSVPWSCCLSMEHSQP